MGSSKYLAKCVIVPIGQFGEWKPQQINQWISTAGGKMETKLSKETTHVVVDGRTRKKNPPILQKAVEARNKGMDIKIVSYDWLDDSFSNKSKKQVGPYLWAKLDKATTTEQSPPKEPKTQAGMLTEVFKDSTDKYVSEAERKKLDKGIEHAKRVKKQMEDEAKEDARRKKEEAALFRQGAKKARNEIFSENHHIYTDTTNFKYDITLVKVDTAKNRNERYMLTLQIYESNSEPHTYATNIQFAGTHLTAKNNIVAPVGCNFAVAFRAFKESFKELTRVNWDQRISFDIERKLKERLERGQGSGSIHGSVKGIPVSEGEAGLHKPEDFAKKAFEYHPPTYGSQGLLPESEMEKLENLAGQAGTQIQNSKKAAENKLVEAWMSGGNGEAPVEVLDSQTADHNPAPTKTVHVGGFIEDDEDEDINTGAPTSGHPSDNPIGTPMDAILDAGDFDSFMTGILGPGLDSGQHLGPVEANNDYDNVFGDDAFEFPFDHDADFGLPLEPCTTFDAGQNDPAQQISFNDTAVEDSFVHGTQEVGETQIAEKARGEFEEMIDTPQLSVNSDDPTLAPRLNLGSSILGKRKSPADDDIEATKKVNPNATDRVGDLNHESEYLLSSQGAAPKETSVPRALAEDMTGPDEQLLRETQMAVTDDEGMVA